MKCRDSVYPSINPTIRSAWQRPSVTKLGAEADLFLYSSSCDRKSRVYAMENPDNPVKTPCVQPALKQNTAVQSFCGLSASPVVWAFTLTNYIILGGSRSIRKPLTNSMAVMRSKLEQVSELAPLTTTNASIFQFRFHSIACHTARKLLEPPCVHKLSFWRDPSIL